MNNHPIRFIRRGQLLTLNQVEPSRTLLEVLREDLGHTDTKEACGEGDCGACTVVVGQACGDKLSYRAINSCIKLAHSIDGMALWTAQDIAPNAQELHPAQQAMVQCHGSQCGFCTPGFVMSLFGMYQNFCRQGQAISRAQAQEALSGNLCRCTGYQSILEAASTMGSFAPVQLDEPALLAQLKALALQPSPNPADSSYQMPSNLADLLQARSEQPKAQLVAGCTDVGLWVTKQHQTFDQVIDLSQVAELRQIRTEPEHLLIGAAVPLSEAFAALVAGRPQLGVFAQRFAGLPVRNAGTLGGNVANGSPIGDSMPLLLALDSTVVLASRSDQRELALAAFYTGYRKNVLAADEVLIAIKIPRPLEHEFLRVYKVSKRFEDDISAVCLALCLRIEDGRVLSASIGAGGVARTPVRARQTEAMLSGQAWSQELVQQAMQTLRQEFQPISDMRASAAYRTAVLGNLLQRFWLESQGQANTNLESFQNQGAIA